MNKSIIVFLSVFLFATASFAAENQQSNPSATRFQQYNQKIPKQYEPLNSYIQPTLFYGYGGVRRFGYDANFVNNSSVNDYAQGYGYGVPGYDGIYAEQYMMVNPAASYRQYKRDNSPDAYVEHDTIVSPEEYNFIQFKK